MKATAYFDGACNNVGDGLAGFGALLVLENGDVYEIYGCLSQNSTSNIAEYAALIEAMRAASQLGVTDLQVFGDSMLVVMQMKKKWRVTHPNMKVAHEIAAKLASRFASITYTWIPRERNGEADDLSRVGQGGRPFTATTVRKRA